MYRIYEIKNRNYRTSSCMIVNTIDKAWLEQCDSIPIQLFDNHEIVKISPSRFILGDSFRRQYHRKHGSTIYRIIYIYYMMLTHSIL